MIWLKLKSLAYLRTFLEYLEIDIANLEVGSSIHLTEIALPEGVQIVALLQSEEHNASVVRVSKVTEQPEEDIQDIEQQDDDTEGNSNE